MTNKNNQINKNIHPNLDNLQTKLYLDSGDMREIKTLQQILGYLDGVTTNPSLVAKIPEIKEIYEKNGGFTQANLLKAYKQHVQLIRSVLPEGSISVEVYADKNSMQQDLLEEAIEMSAWTAGLHIKLPVIKQALAIMPDLIARNIGLNLTLVFTQEQVAAVNKILETSSIPSYISCFVGRLDDAGFRGLDNLYNAKKIINPDSKVELLAASIRSSRQIKEAIQAGSDIVTAPLKAYQEWASEDFSLDLSGASITEAKLLPIPFNQGLSSDLDPADYNLYSSFTSKGLDGFTQDWNSLLK